MAETDHEPMSRLADLATAVDRRFAEIQQRRSACMECRSGCSDCCRSRLSVTRVEAAKLRRGLERLPAAVRDGFVRRARDPERETCPALDPRGRCQVYEFRPLICRSFGVPLRRRGEVSLVNPPVVDVCDKNFHGTSLRTLPPEDVIDQTDLDRAVAEIDDEHCARHGLPRGERIPLARILAGEDPDA